MIETEAVMEQFRSIEGQGFGDGYVPRNSTGPSDHQLHAMDVDACDFSDSWEHAWIDLGGEG
jgi:hypothetical protein